LTKAYTSQALRSSASLEDPGSLFRDHLERDAVQGPGPH